MDNLQEVLECCTNELLIPFEGYHKKLPNGDCIAYPDPATGGIPFTIGYGSTKHPNGVSVKEGEVWTKEYAVECKQRVLQGFLRDLLRLSPSLVSEPPRRVAAVLSWVYNLGLGNYRVSTFKKKIDIKDWTAAFDECKKWDKANGKKMKGLTRRRLAEAMMILLP